MLREGIGTDLFGNRKEDEVPKVKMNPEGPFQEVGREDPKEINKIN